MVMIELLVIIQMRVAASRARRGVVVRRTAKKNIQGGMTIRLKGPRSRQNERHEERKGKEKEKRERGPDGQRVEKKKEPQLLVHSARFHVWLKRRGCLWVREDLHTEQMEIFLVNGHVATAVGAATLSMATSTQ